MVGFVTYRNDSNEKKEQGQLEEKKTLLGLYSEYRWVESELEETQGEITPEIEARITEKLTALCEKADAYGVVIDRLKKAEEFYIEQAAKLTGFAKTVGAISESLRERMRIVLGGLPDKSIQGEYYRFFLAKAKDKVTIDEALLPKGYFKTKVSIIVDRDLINAELAEGKTIPGVTVEPNTSLRVGRPK